MPDMCLKDSALVARVEWTRGIVLTEMFKEVLIEEADDIRPFGQDEDSDIYA